MAELPSRLPQARQILKVAQTDKQAAQEILAAMPLEEQVLMVCEAPLAVRANLLELTPAPEPASNHKRAASSSPADAIKLSSQGQKATSNTLPARTDRGAVEGRG